jgi:hypothetical protein
LRPMPRRVCLTMRSGGIDNAPGRSSPDNSAIDRSSDVA